MSTPKPESSNGDEKIIPLDQDAAAKAQAEEKLKKEKHAKFVEELLVKGAKLAKLEHEAKLASGSLGKQAGRRSFAGVCRLNRRRVKAVIRKAFKPVTKFISNQRVLPIVFFKDTASTQPLMRHFQEKPLDGQLPSWWLVSQKKFFSYTVLAWKLWPRGQSTTIKQTTENKTSPTAAETEEKKVMKTPTTTQDGKGLTISGADDPAIAGFTLTLTEMGSNVRLANARINLETPVKEYRIDNWLEKLGKPEDIKAKLKAGSGCLLKVFVFAKDGVTTPVSQYEFDAAATEKIFGTPKSETVPPTPEPGLSKAEVAEMITGALAALASQITQAQAAADANKAAEQAKADEAAKAAEAAKKANDAQEKKGEKFPWKSWFNFKLIRQCAGWLLICLALIGLAWCYVHWDLGTKAKKYFASKQGSAATATTNSNGSPGDIPVTPDNDPNGQTTTGSPDTTTVTGSSTTSQSSKVIVEGASATTTNNASGGSITFGNVTGSNNITAFIVHGNYTVNPPGMVIATNTTERSVSELHRNNWPQGKKSIRRKTVTPRETLLIGETDQVIETSMAGEDVEFVYPHGFLIDAFIRTPGKTPGYYEEIDDGQYDIALDGSVIGNNTGIPTNGKILRINNRSGLKMVIGFRCTKTSESFDFRTASR